MDDPFQSGSLKNDDETNALTHVDLYSDCVSNGSDEHSKRWSGHLSFISIHSFEHGSPQTF